MKIFCSFFFYLSALISVAPLSGGSHVHFDCRDFRHLLFSLSHILRVLVPSSEDIQIKHCAAHLPRHLLAGHVEQHGKPIDLRMDEQTLPTLFPEGHVLLLPQFGARRRQQWHQQQQ